jgi:Na+/H+-dicarboxylate symporter
VPVIPADPISPVVIVLSIVILAVALGLFVMLLKDESASPPTAPADDL